MSIPDLRKWGAKAREQNIDSFHEFLGRTVLDNQTSSLLASSAYASYPRKAKQEFVDCRAAGLAQGRGSHAEPVAQTECCLESPEESRLGPERGAFGCFGRFWDGKSSGTEQSSIASD